MSEHKLFIKDNTGKIRFWSCGDSFEGLIIEHGVLGGATQYQVETITTGLAGRDWDEQVESRIQSRVNKQLDKGYVYDLRTAESMRPVNSLGFVKPMLAKSMEDVDMPRMLKMDYYVQNKLDGNRCMIHNCGEIVAYTRNGKEFKTLKHITDQLKNIIPDGYTFDGEMYVHGVPLQTLVSWGKRLQPNTLKLEYHIYDMVSPERFSVRHAELRGLLRGIAQQPSNGIYLVPTIACGPRPHSMMDVTKRLQLARSQRYEGLMVRSDYTLKRDKMLIVGYEDGARSGSLIKVKDWLNSEFRIIDIKPSADGWAMLVCENPNGHNFDVTCPGDVPFKMEVLKNKDDYIGKMVSVKFAYWTIDNVPFQPTAEAIRDYE